MIKLLDLFKGHKRSMGEGFNSKSGYSKNIHNSLKIAMDSLDEMKEIIKTSLSDDVSDTDIQKVSKDLSLRIDHLSEQMKDIQSMVTKYDDSPSTVEIVEFREFNLRSMLQKLVDDYQNSNSRGVRIYELNYNAQKETAVMNQENIKFVFDELLKNATQHTIKGLIIVQVSINDDSWCISVKDSGEGMSMNTINEIFADDSDLNAKKVNSLKKVKHIIDLHQGNVQVSTMPGKRTVITIQIPKKLTKGKYNIPLNSLGKPVTDQAHRLRI